MAQYTKLSSEELTDIVSHYPVGNTLLLENISGGFGNSNFKLTTTKGTFLLKICDEKNITELQMQMKLLIHLQQHSYPTVYPVLLKSGEMLYVTQDYNVMIYPFLEGKTPNPSQNVLEQIGSALAQLHRISPLTGLPRFPMGMIQITPFLDEVKETQFHSHPFLTWLKSELDWIKPELEKTLPKGLLHGDLFLDNTLFDGNKMVAILDFEEACHDILLIDVAMTIIGCCYTNQHQLDIPAVHGFLYSYNSMRPLTEDEWDSLDGFVHYAALSIAFWRFRQFNIRYPDVVNAELYQEMITRSTNWQSITL